MVLKPGVKSPGREREGDALLPGKGVGLIFNWIHKEGESGK